jgi:HSP20 family molecular chaperone IbpA
MSKEAIKVNDVNNPTNDGLFSKIGSTIEKIRDRAHSLFEARGGQSEAGLEDWLQAERDLFHIPPCELSDAGQAYELKVATPGFQANQLKVAVDQNWVTVSGEAEQKSEKSDKQCVYSEFGRKELFRRFQLASSVDVDRAKATLEDGVLTIVLAKLTDAPATTEKASAKAA